MLTRYKELLMDMSTAMLEGIRKAVKEINKRAEEIKKNEKERN